MQKHQGADAPEYHSMNGDEARLLPFIDMARWPRLPPERQWAVPDRIPLRQPTLWTGKGGGGKTMLALQLSVATVLGKLWLGLQPQTGGVIYIGTEDEEDELHRRIADVAQYYGTSLAKLHARGLSVASLAGRDALLAVADREYIIKPTALYEELYVKACDLRPRLIVLDTVSDVYGGDENDRSEVTAFIALMRRLAMDANAAVIMMAHPSQSGLQTGTGLSGSTAWHSKVRSQLYLKHMGATRELQFLKSNYGPEGEAIPVIYQDGVFVAAPSAGSLEMRAREEEAETVFLNALDRFTAQNRSVSANFGPTYAPKHFASEPEAGGYTKQELEAAMRRLLNNGGIVVITEGPPSKRRTKLARRP